MLHSVGHPTGFFTEDFKDLITSMLQFHPHQRLTFASIVCHKWLQGECATETEVKEEISRRQNIIMKNQHYPCVSFQTLREQLKKKI